MTLRCCGAADRVRSKSLTIEPVHVSFRSSSSSSCGSNTFLDRQSQACRLLGPESSWCPKEAFLQIYSAAYRPLICDAGHSLTSRRIAELKVLILFCSFKLRRSRPWSLIARHSSSVITHRVRPGRCRPQSVVYPLERNTRKNGVPGAVPRWRHALDHASRRCCWCLIPAAELTVWILHMTHRRSQLWTCKRLEDR